MEILKFGGTSVGNAHALSCLKLLVESKRDNVVVVVSALAGATDQLLRISKLAAENGSWQSELNALKDRHLKAIEDSVILQHQGRVWATTLQTIAELKKILESVAILEEISLKTSDMIVSFGERLSAPIVTGIFENAQMLHALDIFVTKQFFDKQIIDFPATSNKIKALDLSNKIYVCSGFISKDNLGRRITNLGRGGSDYTAAILAAELNAKVLEIYTDVDGFLTADPKVVENAKLIDELDFFDAIELCNYGAKVIYSPTIFPVFHKNIEIKIRNTFNPKCLGSSIIKSKRKDFITGISSINDLSLIRIVGNLSGLRYRVYKSLSSNGVELFFAAADSFGVHFCDIKKTVAILESEFSQEIAMGRIDNLEVTNNLAMVAVVGSFGDLSAWKAQIVTLLNDHDVNVIAFGEDCSTRVVTYVVPIQSVRNAIIATHKLIGTSGEAAKEISGDVVAVAIEKLKRAGDEIVKIEKQDNYTFITTKRYREYPLRIENAK